MLEILAAPVERRGGDPRAPMDDIAERIHDDIAQQAELEVDDYGHHETTPEDQAAADRAAFVAASVVWEVSELRTKCPRTNSPSSSSFTPDVSCASAPWCVLLSADFTPKTPFGWTCTDMLAIRATCTGLRGDRSASAYFGDLLHEMGCIWSMPAASTQAPANLHRLCDALLAELEFVRRINALGRPTHPGMCCIAGSHALHRMMQFELRMANPGFRPADMDVFVAHPTAFAAVVSLSKLFLTRVERRVPTYELSGTADGYGRIEFARSQWGALWPPDHPHQPTTYPLERVVDALSTWRDNPPFQSNVLVSKAAWLPAIGRLPAEVGLPKPFRVVRCGRVRGTGGRVDFGSLALPNNVNVVQLGFGEPTAAARVIDGFDMQQCKVVMHTSASRFAFACSETTRQCAEQRQIRLTRYALAPLIPGGTDSLWVYKLMPALKEMIRRIRKYEKHGFELVEAEVE
jgi:hypothetical protein